MRSPGRLEGVTVRHEQHGRAGSLDHRLPSITAPAISPFSASRCVTKATLSPSLMGALITECRSNWSATACCSRSRSVGRNGQLVSLHRRHDTGVRTGRLHTAVD